MRPGNAFVRLALLLAVAVPAAWTTTASRAPDPQQAVAAAAAAGTTTFSAVGDFGSGTAARATFAALGTSGGEATLALGDYSYSTTLTESQWCDLVHAGTGDGYPFELVSGNHESNGENGFIDAYTTCLPNQLPGLRGQYGRQWWVDQPAGAPLVRFIAVSPGIPFPEGTLDYSAGSARYQWTANAIDGARAAGIPWVVVAMHVPCLSVGNYGCTGIEDLTNLFVQKKVDLVLSGHEHLYQRTHQIALGTGCTAITPGSYQAACVVDTDNAYTKGRGTVFATVGTGGVESRAANLADPELPWFAAVSASNQNPAFGFLSLTATADRLDARFVRSGTGTFTDAFAMDRTTPPGNQPPTAVATSTCTNLACTFDGSGSSDADGTITSYAWAYGDGTTGTGASSPHTYATAGTYTATLTVTDDGGATATATRTVTVTTAPPANQPPTSVAAATCTDLTCTFDGRGSSDPDGTIASYAWAYGDGTTGTGSTGPHTSAAAGTYTATLTVTDDAGATATTTRTVTVTAPPPPPTSIATDTFSRTVASGWGTADVGGAWAASVPSGATASVSGGRGLLGIGSGRTVTMSLAPTSARTDLSATWSLDKVPTGSGLYVSAVVRRVTGQGDYRAKVRHLSTGGVGVSLVRTSSTGTETVLAAEVAAPGVTLTANDRLAVRVRAVGTGTTTLQVRVWKVGTTEPTTWLRTATDTTAGLQTAGAVSLSGYLSSSATNGPVTMAVDDLDVEPVP